MRSFLKFSDPLDSFLHRENDASPRWKKKFNFVSIFGIFSSFEPTCFGTLLYKFRYIFLT